MKTTMKVFLQSIKIPGWIEKVFFFNTAIKITSIKSLIMYNFKHLILYVIVKNLEISI